MEENPGPRVVELTSAAVSDLASIDNATAAIWGDAQADRYQKFLREIFSYLSLEPGLGVAVTGRPGLLLFVAKYSKKRSAHGHRIFYRQIDGGIRVIRILHTAMNWPDVLG